LVAKKLGKSEPEVRAMPEAGDSLQQVELVKTKYWKKYTRKVDLGVRAK
jgi:hypothetical protein